VIVTQLDINIVGSKWKCASTVTYFKLFILKPGGTIFYHIPFMWINLPI
jgi:hypothetical protein